MRTRSMFLFPFLAMLCFATTLWAQQNQVSSTASTAAASPVPRLIKFSGTLLDELGRPMKSPVGVTFALYAQQSEGTTLWMETQNVETDAKGNYTVLLGANSANGVPAELFASGEARWLGVQAERQLEQPRVLLVSVPYALKAGDAQTLGGLPPSAFAPAGSNAPTNSSLTPLLLTSPGSASPAAAPLTGTTPVTTGGLTSGTVPVADGTSDIMDSHITDNGTTVTVAEPLGLASTGTAVSGSTGGKNSQPFDLFGSTFSSALATAIPQHFRLQEEPVGQNTATPSGKVSLLYALGSAVPAETGFSINSKGIVTFAPGQTFADPGDVKSVGLSAPATDFTVSGSPVTSTGTLKFAWNVVPTNLNTANAIVKRDGTGSFSAGAGTFSGNLASGGTVFGAGGSFTGLNIGAGGLADVGGASFGGNVGIGTGSPGFKLHVVDSSNTGLRVQTNTVGGTVASFGGNGAFQIDSPGTPAGRFVVTEPGSVGIKMSAPTTTFDLGSGAISIDDSNGGLWFKTTDFGFLDTHHMLIGSDNTSTKQESLAIYHCNITPLDAAVSGCLTGGNEEAFRFQWDGFAFAANSWNAGGVDVAEKYPNFAPSLEAGDVVMLDTTSASDLRLMASTAPYQENVLGVVSEKPGVMLGGSGEKLEDAKGIPLALTGRVPVKVTLENGPIHAGDYLTSSSRAGYAMRATKSGRVIGVALTSFGSDADPTAATGKVTVFVNAHHWESPEEAREMRAELRTLKAQLESRDENYRQLRTELEELKHFMRITTASLVVPAEQVDQPAPNSEPARKTSNK